MCYMMCTDAQLEDSGEIICGVSATSAAAKTLSVCGMLTSVYPIQYNSWVWLFWWEWHEVTHCKTDLYIINVDEFYIFEL